MKTPHPLKESEADQRYVCNADRGETITVPYGKRGKPHVGLWKCRNLTEARREGLECGQV